FTSIQPSVSGDIVAGLAHTSNDKKQRRKTAIDRFSGLFYSPASRWRSGRGEMRNPGLVGCRKQHKSTRYPLVDGSASGSVGGGWPELILRTSGALFGGMDAAGRFDILCR